MADNGQGQVNDPANDGRLKENGGGSNPSQHASDDGRGQVKDPSTDGRLKDNGGGQQG